MTTDDDTNSSSDINDLEKYVADRPTPENTFVAGMYAQRLVQTALSGGTTLENLAQASGVPIHDLESPPERVSGEAYRALMIAGAQLCNDPHFGVHVGENISPAAYPVLGYTLMSCENLQHALAQLTRYESIIHNLGSFHLRVEGDLLYVEWENFKPGGECGRHITESVLAGVRVFARSLVGSDFPIHRLEMTHEAPADPSTVQNLFGGTIEYGASTNQAVSPADILQLPIIHADKSLFPVLKQHADRLLQLQCTQGGIIQEVRQILVESLSSGLIKLSQIAKKLSMHPRTLQRRLSEAETTYQHVLDGVRRDLGEYYLRQSDVSISEVAFLLGYHDQSSFNRAFRDWVGQSPSAYRNGDTPSPSE